MFHVKRYKVDLPLFYTKKSIVLILNKLHLQTLFTRFQLEKCYFFIRKWTIIITAF